jgi:superfamily II DNA/RNA helicase
MANTKDSLRDLFIKIEKLEAILKSFPMSSDKQNIKTSATLKKPRNTTNKGYLAKAKMLFYHENKLTKAVQDKMKDFDFIAENNKNHNRVKWRLLKTITDNMFEELPDDVQDKYVHNARECNLETIAEEVGEEIPLD